MIFENFASCGLLAMFVKPDLQPIFIVPFHPQKWLIQVVMTRPLCPDDPGSNPTRCKTYLQSPAVMFRQISASDGRRGVF